MTWERHSKPTQNDKTGRKALEPGSGLLVAEWVPLGAPTVTTSAVARPLDPVVITTLAWLMSVPTWQGLWRVVRGVRDGGRWVGCAAGVCLGLDVIRTAKRAIPAFE